MNTENERQSKKCIYDGIRITKSGADAIVFCLSLTLLGVLLYAVISSLLLT